MVRAVVVDNNFPALLLTSKQLVESGAFKSIIPFEDSTVAAKYVEDNGCDVVFMEVEMKGMNGFELLKKIQRQYVEICLVFLTNNRRYALDAFESGATDYILKPIDMESIYRVIKKITPL